MLLSPIDQGGRTPSHYNSRRCRLRCLGPSRVTAGVYQIIAQGNSQQLKCQISVAAFLELFVASRTESAALLLLSVRMGDLRMGDPPPTGDWTSGAVIPIDEKGRW